MLARDRQPTGRMLADVLRRSFEDVRLTGIGGRTTDKAIIQNYVRIYTICEIYPEIYDTYLKVQEIYPNICETYPNISDNM